MEKVSIIIPIYNAEKYLFKCLNSIKEQTYTNIEVLMINDGSTDNSETICKEFLKDSRFCLINKKNGGVSSARNLGINRCNGEYVLFVDSDDWCDKELLKQAVQNIKSYDMLCFAYYKAYKDKNICEELKVNKNANIKKEILSNKLIGGYLWNKLFSTNIIKEHGIKFNESITYCEDLIFIIQYIKYVKKVNYINKALYYYRVRKNSVSNDFYSNKNISILNAYELLINEYNECDFFVNNLKFSESATFSWINNGETLTKESNTPDVYITPYKSRATVNIGKSLLLVWNSTQKRKGACRGCGKGRRSGS